MLILSRRAQQQIIFPHLGITVSVLQVKGRLVKLGIEAPTCVKVIRQEVVERTLAGETVDDPDATQDPGRLSHKTRNELNLLQLRLQMLQRQLDRGETIESQNFGSLLAQLSQLDHDLTPFSVGELPRKQGNPIRLLVVDDSDNERQLMAYLLASSGFDVQVARDGEEALELLQKGPDRPDLVLMDMQMPRANGLEALERIRRDSRLAQLPVYVVTGMRETDAASQFPPTWDGWFLKPVNVDQLIETICLAMSTSRTSTSRPGSLAL